MAAGWFTRSVLRQEAEQGTGSDGGADDASHIGTHGMHEQEVVAVVLQTEVVGDAGGHGNGTNTGIANQWVLT